MSQLSFFDPEHVEQSPRDPRVEQLLYGFQDASYKTFPKREQDKVRWLHDPNESMREAHELIKELTIPTDAISPYATALHGGPRANAERHLGNRFFYLLDLKDAYGQIQMPTLAEFLHNHHLPAEANDIEAILDRFCRKPDGQGLCQGGPASPLLFNTALYDIDMQLAEICTSYDLTLTRYGDDITVSGKEEIGKRKRKRILSILKEAGLTINYQKTHRHDLAVAPVVITGIQINTSGKIVLPRDLQKKTAAFLDRLCMQVFEEKIPLTDEQIQEIGGYKGLLVSTHDRSRENLTDFEEDMLIKIKVLQLSRWPNSRAVIHVGSTAIKMFNGEPIRVKRIEDEGHVNQMGRVKVLGSIFELPEQE
jgi:hypothetical protein